MDRLTWLLRRWIPKGDMFNEARTSLRHIVHNGDTTDAAGAGLVAAADGHLFVPKRVQTWLHFIMRIMCGALVS